MKPSTKWDTYARDRSMYFVRPAHVFFPHNEIEVVGMVRHANLQGVALTPRGGGTGLSGACLGEGWVIDFSQNMNQIKRIGKHTRVQAGILLEDFRPALEKKGYFLPSVPLHGKCAIGGNVNTRSVGPRSMKYGLMDTQVVSVRGVLADGRILDTSKKIPSDLVEKVRALQTELKRDKKLVRYIRSRPPVSGGYNLKALLDYSAPKKIITQLIPGSVGTLLLLTEVELALPRSKPIQDVYTLHFSSYASMQKGLNALIKLGAVSVEFAGEKVLALWDKKYHFHGSKGIFIAEFEHSPSLKALESIALHVKHVPEKDRKHLWKVRQKTLPKLEAQAKRLGMSCPSIVDDTSIHTKDFGKVLQAVDAYAQKKGLDISSFGHAGVGSIHLRVFFDLKRHPNQLNTIGKDIFNIVQKYGGTLIGEHNGGRCRSHFLSMENKAMYAFMRKIKKAFDPENRLNPHILFDIPPITKHIKV